MPKPANPTLPSAPKRSTDVTPVTPLIGDLLLYEVEDCSRRALPQYGTRHPKRRVDDPSKFKHPDHELVLIRPLESEREGIYEFIYAAERSSQDLYNFEFAQADIGGVKFSAVQRDYLIKRASFSTENAAMGSSMPSTPADTFPGDYLLAERKQVRTERELDSLYIAERRTYVKRVNIINYADEARFGGNFKTTETLYYRGEVVSGGAAVEALFADAKNTYWDVQTDGSRRTGQQLSENWFMVRQTIYEPPGGSVEDQNLWTWTDADIGGNKFKAVSLTKVVPKTAYNLTTPAMGASLSGEGPNDLGGHTYVLAERKVIPSGDQLVDKLYVIEERVYVKKVTMTVIGVDELNGQELTAKTTLYYATEVVSGESSATALFDDPTNSFWGLQDNGWARTGQQLSANWFAVTEEQKIGGSSSAGVIAVDSYFTNETYYWPPVLSTLSVRVWARHDQGTDIYPDYVFSREGYRGPCKALVTRTWKRTPQVIDQVQIMKPDRIQYASPGFSMNVPECLHGTLSLTCDYGTSDPVYRFSTGSTKWFYATNYTDWPATIIASDDQQPFRGGFLRTQVVIYRPE